MLPPGPLGSFIAPARSLDKAVERVRRAESLGYHSAYVTHIAGRDSLTVLAAAVTDAETARASLRGGPDPVLLAPLLPGDARAVRLREDVAAFDAAMQDGGPERAAAAISDRFLQTLTAIGSIEEAEASVRRYFEAGATSPCLGGVPGTDFDATLEALAHLTKG